jgi:uncharacterized protein YgfB (UPF0149 family)
VRGINLISTGPEPLRRGSGTIRKMAATPAFDDVALVLASAGSAVHASEAHGCLCGALCARRVYLPGEWMEELLPDPAPEEGAQVVNGPLADLFEHSRSVLAGREMEFEPLLPGDAVDLAERVEALAAWVQGFLYGFGAAGPFPRGTLPAEITEVLSDFAEISRAGAVGAETADLEEEAYAELVEFVRVGVQLIFDGLAAQRESQTVSAARH